MKKVVSWFFYKVLGWKIEGDFPVNFQKYVVIVVPHTSWVDFPMGILIRYITGIESRFVGKESLFKGPFGWFFNAMGGIPVNRSNRQNFVDKIVAFSILMRLLFLACPLRELEKKSVLGKQDFTTSLKMPTFP